MEIFEKLRKHAENKGLSFSKIGEESGKSQQTISNYMSGKNQIPLDWLCWYLEKNPEISVASLFNTNSERIDFVGEQAPIYQKKFDKVRLLERIGKILDEEL